MSLVKRIKRANQAGPPEESVPFRAATAAAVAVSIVACWAQGELAAWVMTGSVALVLAGNVFSHRRRADPPSGLKLFLAVAVLLAFGWFFVSVSARSSIGDLGAVEGPLAVLFTWIQVTHAFDVPSRRDLGFSLAGSVTLMAVAAAQAVDTTFGVYVVVWAACCVAGLSAMWSSMAGGEPIRLRSMATSSSTVLMIGLGLVWLLPPPHPSSHVVFPSSLANDLPIATPGGLVGGGNNGSEPLHAGSAAGADRVGGLLGFAGPLNTAIRGSLGNAVVLRVRADRPSFWIAETFDRWTGQSWLAAPSKERNAFRPLALGPPFSVPLPVGEPGGGEPDLQTFYLAKASANLIFHAADASQVWFPANRLYISDDGTIRSGTTMGPGSVYTVESLVNAPPARQLRQDARTAGPGNQLPSAVLSADLALPHSYPRVRALAERITAGSTNVYDTVTDLESWIGAHTRYTTDIPPLRAGDDTVTEFLFGNRRGFCEQISTSLAVMLRSLGIPAREATGYVPGSFNPITDLYEVQAKDAHAWVQVWFPGHGWQSFDPTAVVPLANPSPAATLTHDAGAILGSTPVVALLVAATLTAAVWTLRRRRRKVPPTWASQITRELEAAARRGGVTTRPSEPLVNVARALDVRRTSHDPPSTTASTLAWHAERAAYGGTEPSDSERRAMLRDARRLRRTARALRRRPALSATRTPTPPPTRNPQPTEAGRP